MITYRLLQVIVVIALASSISLAEQDVQRNPNVCEGCSVDLLDDGSTSEIPQGAIDGKNTSFFLSRMPNSEIPLQFFRSGVLLTDGTDYHVAGQVISLSVSQTPLPGDVIEVKYVRSSRRRSQPRTGPVNAGVPLNRSNELALAAGRRALEDEIGQAKSTRAILSDSGPSRLGASEESNTRIPESLRMLSTRTNKVSNPPEPQREFSVQGVEGLGDRLPLTPLRSVPLIGGRDLQDVPLPTAANRMPRVPTSGIVSQSGSSAALNMLQRALVAQPSSTPAAENVPKPQKQKQKASWPVRAEKHVRSIL